jgi:hypothetical protein
VISDNLRMRSYSAAMERGEPFIILRLCTKEPIELGAFVGAFASLGNEYERYIKSTNPDLVGPAEMYVREVRPGSIEADLIPWLSIAAPFISDIEKALIIDKFITVWGDRFKALLGIGKYRRHRHDPS